MSVVFLIGGTGNQLFAYAASDPKDTFSEIFLHRAVRRTLRWTLHEQVLHYPRPNMLMHGFALLVLAVDTILAALTGLSLFSTLDTRRIKARPLLFEIARLGYFQQAPERRDVGELADQFPPVIEAGQIVLHVRGGDFLVSEGAGESAYGVLGQRYYRAGIAVALADLARREQPTSRILVLTDDVGHASALDLVVEGGQPAEIRNCPLGETLSIAVGADWFVSSNSTMAYWILRLRKGLRSVAPQPFQRHRDYLLPDDCVRIPMDGEG